MGEIDSKEEMLTSEDQQLISEVLSTSHQGEVTLQKALKHYQTIYMPSRNWATKTRINYRNDIADLIKFLERHDKTQPAKVSLNDLEAYLADLDRRDYKGTSRRRKTFAIKSFFGF